MPKCFHCDRDQLQAPGTDASFEALFSAEAVSPHVSLVTVPAGAEVSIAEMDSSLSVALMEGKLSNFQCADIVSLFHWNKVYFPMFPHRLA